MQSYEKKLNMRPKRLFFMSGEEEKMQMAVFLIGYTFSILTRKRGMAS